jgi:hypothetical protein
VTPTPGISSHPIQKSAAAAINQAPVILGGKAFLPLSLAAPIFSQNLETGKDHR